MTGNKETIDHRLPAVCPFCEGSEFIECYQSGYATVSALSNTMGGAPLYHLICRNCGCVVRSYVKEPEKLLKKKMRRPTGSV